jgi:osmotically inducible protein OsmC
MCGSSVRRKGRRANVRTYDAAMATTRKATTQWQGSLLEGAGKVTLESSGLGTFDVTWASRAEDPNGRTSPEELIAAAHSSCFAMQFSDEIAEAGGTPHSLEVTAEVTFGPLKEGGMGIPKVALTVRGEVEGLDEAGFKQAAEAAKVNCPVSKALAAVDEISMDAALVQ